MSNYFPFRGFAHRKQRKEQQLLQCTKLWNIIKDPLDHQVIGETDRIFFKICSLFGVRQRQGSRNICTRAEEEGLVEFFLIRDDWNELASKRRYGRIFIWM